jgi:hypothetical protein
MKACLPAISILPFVDLKPLQGRLGTVKESFPVLIVQEDQGSVDSPIHDMVQDNKNIESALPGQEDNIPE